MAKLKDLQSPIFRSNYIPVPEFGTLGVVLALVGTGLVIYRKRKLG